MARFNEEGRAAYVALALYAEGIGVMWDPEKPHIVATQLDRPEFREFTKRHPGVLSEWWNQAAIWT